MYDDYKTATDDQFYTELINKFFNPRSYFYYCIETFLKSPSLIINNPEASIINLIAQLIDFLIISKKTTSDLKEITQIKGFEHTYKNLENQILRYDLKSLHQTQQKKAIQKIALSLLKDIYDSLINYPKSQQTLNLYIEIKSKLRDLLNGTNGKHKTSNSLKTIEPDSLLSTNSPAHLPSESSNFTTENSHSESSNENSRDLKNEAQNEQSSGIEQYSAPTPEQENSSNFEINTSFKEFKTSTERSTTRPITPSIFSGLLAESNNSEEHDSEIIIPGENDNDEEDLLKLIHEIDSKKESLPLKNFDDIKEMKESNSLDIPPIENVAPPIQPNDDENKSVIEHQTKEFETNQEEVILFDDSINKIFQQEAVLYYKILSNAIIQLKNDEKIQSALEDIELASSSLQHLALKFGMEKLALLPELIESISRLSNKHLINLPVQIVQGIEDGVNLLKEFDVNKTDDRAKFMSILILLKEYYMKTLSTTKNFPVSF